MAGANPLAGYNIEWWGSPCFTAGRAIPWDHYTPHHVAGFGIPTFPWERQASSTFSVHGLRIIQHVSADNSPWTEGNYYANASAETCEHVNAWGEPDWGLLEQTFDTGARLCASRLIARGQRTAIYTGFADHANIYQHRDLGLQGFSAATRCPGEWFRANFTRWLNLVNQYLNAYYNPAPLPPPVEFEWKQWATPSVMKCIANPTNLFNFNTGEVIKAFNLDDQIVIFGEGRRKDRNEWFYMTEYSFTQKITNGFKSGSLAGIILHPEIEPAPEPEIPEIIPEPETPSTPIPAVLVWKQWDEPKKMVCHSVPTCLWDFDKTSFDDFTTPILEFWPGDVLDIYGECHNETLDMTFYLTEWSFTRNLTNGFRAIDLEDIPEEVLDPDQEIFEPEPDIPVDPIEPEPIKPEKPELPIETEKKGGEESEYPNWFVNFWIKLFKAILGIFKKSN